MLCSSGIDEQMDVFLNMNSTKVDVTCAGVKIFQHIYNAPGTTLGATRFNMFMRKTAAKQIKPETLPPTEGAAVQHSHRAYLQTRDRILLQSMSLNPCEYGWTLGVHGYEPVPTKDAIGPEELLKFTICNCSGDCSNRRCSCKKNGVNCITACGVCNGATCQNGVQALGSRNDSDIDV